MTDPAQLRPAARPRVDAAVARVEVASPEFSRFLYTAVGGDWYWTDRLPWTYDRWTEWLDRDELETWVVSVRGAPAGYVELEAQPDGDVEVVSFGLLPRFTGHGIGGRLLTVAVQRAWQRGTAWAVRGGSASRVWLHTCSLDGPAALSNYKARGFRVTAERTATEDLPTAPPGPWPGARDTTIVLDRSPPER